MNKKSTKGITFAVPRNSLMLAIKYRIFDDLLIGNFMKTTLHNCKSLYESECNFTLNVSKIGDNGCAESREEVEEYLDVYRKRAGIEFLANFVVDSFESKSRDFLLRFIARDSKIFQKIKSFYLSTK